jgi:hypothetical protein
MPGSSEESRNKTPLPLVDLAHKNLFFVKISKNVIVDVMGDFQGPDSQGYDTLCKFQTH